jgi:hypothetical protein
MGPCKIKIFRGELRGLFGRYLAVCAMAASLLFLILCPFASGAGRQAFSIKVVTSLDDQFWVNSVIIEGAHSRVCLFKNLQTKKMIRVLMSNVDNRQRFLSFFDFPQYSFSVGLCQLRID